tara:strand:+ start:1609 stop:2643 length:1035 start_codon:yes stop_codon:yes gene_type:complete
MAQINKPSLHFNTKLYTGNGSTQSITGVGFQPDWVWIKNRDTTGWHFWTDAVRGAGKAIYSNRTDAEFTDTDNSDINSFLTDGFSVGNNGDVNGNGNNIVAWNWKANGQGSSNTDGSINTTYTSVNTTAGFSISKYTGTGATATIGHGLGVAPKMIIIKQTNTTRNWVVGHNGMGWTKYLYLDSTNAQGTGNFFNDTAPTNSVFSVVNDGGVNSSGGTYIAYCFAEKKGYSKFGSFEGNENANGVFVYTGFKPAFVLAKNTAISDWWSMFDNKRLGFNSSDSPRLLFPNTNSAESTSKMLDFTSNGFKIRSSNTGINGNGNTVIYMAFAENPIVGTNNVAATAG